MKTDKKMAILILVIAILILVAAVFMSNYIKEERIVDLDYVYKTIIIGV